MDKPTIAIAATFTAEPLEQSLLFWMRLIEVPAAIRFAPYNQVFQQLLDPASVLAINHTGINVLLVRFEDWQKLRSPAPETKTGWDAVEENIRRNVEYFSAALQSAVNRSATPHLVCVCPASPRLLADPVRLSFLKQMEQRLLSELPAQQGLLLVTSDELATLYPVVDYYDPHGDELGQIPYTPGFFASLGTLIARRIYALRTAARKVIAVDCDETLWKGVCGEVGPQGVELDPPHKALQECLVAQHDAGMLLCLCSKNNEDDVLAVFDCRPDMPLKRRHFVAQRLNWKPKSKNLESIAEELHLGLDSFIFLDDNPLECAEVETNCPSVLSLQLPESVSTIPQFLRHCWALDHLQVTAEDRQRTGLYRQNELRDRLREEAPTLADFLANLGLEVRISELRPEHLARMAQLTQRTNQFNFTTIRRSAAEIQQLCRSDALECLVVEVSDRFGDYGLVGVIMYRRRAAAIELDTLLLSCRVLGRGVEHRLLNHLGQRAQAHGLDRIDVPFHPTNRNQPALDFLETVGAQFKQVVNDGLLFRFPAADAAGICHVPACAESGSVNLRTNNESFATAAAAEARGQANLLQRIACDLCDAERILAAIKAEKKRTTTRSSGSENNKEALQAPLTPIEQVVAGIWTEVLGIGRVGSHDDFFDLGGDSVLGTQVVSRLCHAFQIQLPLRSLFEAPTVAGLAVVILESLAEKAQSKDVESIMADLEASAHDEALSEVTDHESS